MAGVRRCLRAALLLATWGHAEGDAHEVLGPAETASALVADDECAAGLSREECSLSALQRRGQLHAHSSGAEPDDGDDGDDSVRRRRRRRRRRRSTTQDQPTTTAAPAAPDTGCADAGANGTNGSAPCQAPAAPARPTEAAAWGTCGGDRWTGPTKCVEGYMCVHLTPYYAQCKPAAEKDWVKYNGSEALNKSSEAELMTFYMYRASGSNNYPLMNVNAADMAGVMWYIHNEVVSCVYNDCQQVRRFGIDRIRRYKVSYRATQPLLDAGMHFGIRYAFDSGVCTGPWVCETQFAKYGYFVGCNKLTSGFPFPTWPVFYDGIWYSLPGSCASQKYMDQSMECRADQPGGFCEGTPNGTGTCTYHTEDAGYIFLDELVNLTNYTAFKEAGGEEFNQTLDVGINMTFWNHMNDTEANAKRVEAANDLFKKKYPNMPHDDDLRAPPCDFDKEKFFPDGLPTELNKNNPALKSMAK